MADEKATDFARMVDVMLSALSRSLTLGQYVLEGREPKACDDPLEWCRWFQTADRKVDHDIFFGETLEDETTEVSTVFPGIDHNLREEGAAEALRDGHPLPWRVHDHQALPDLGGGRGGPRLCLREDAPRPRVARGN
jgi:hypothetical protein